MRKAKKAFSTIELLAVMAIMTAIAAVGIPAVSSLTIGSKMNQTTNELAGLLEQARQYAVAQNTYVWVVFNTDNQSHDNFLNVAVVSSKDGTDPGTYGAVPNDNFDLIGKIRVFPHFLLKEAGAFDATAVPCLPANPVMTAANSLAESTVFAIKIPGQSDPVSFSKSLRFSPSGEAQKSAYPIDVIEFALQPVRALDEADAHNIAVLRINGLTGQARVYRP